MKKWLFNPAAGDTTIAAEGTDEIVMYIEDLNKEVVSHIVEMHNTGSSVEEIHKFLDKDLRVTLEESDYVVEQILTFQKLYEDEESTVIVPEAEVSKEPAATQEKVTSTRKKREVKAQVAATDKVITPEDYIELLKEKIVLCEVIGGAKLPEIPTGVSKSSRELMIELNKEYKTLINKYMVLIQQM